MKDSLLPCKNCKADAELLQESKVMNIVCHCHERYHAHENLRTVSIRTRNSEDSRLVLLPTAVRCNETCVHTQLCNIQLQQHNRTISSPGVPSLCGTCLDSFTHCMQRHQVREGGTVESTCLSCRHKKSSIHHQRGKSCFRLPKLGTVSHILLFTLLSLVLFTHMSSAATNVGTVQQASHAAPKILKWNSFDIETVKLSKTTHKASTPVTDSRQIPDSVAVVGRFFQLRVPRTAFSGNPFMYKVSSTILALAHTYVLLRSVAIVTVKQYLIVTKNVVFNRQHHFLSLCG